MNLLFLNLCYPVLTKPYFHKLSILPRASSSQAVASHILCLAETGAFVLDYFTLPTLFLCHTYYKSCQTRVFFIKYQLMAWISINILSCSSRFLLHVILLPWNCNPVTTQKLSLWLPQADYSFIVAGFKTPNVWQMDESVRFSMHCSTEQNCVSEVEK